MTIKEQSHFAAYYNMARHNMYETLCYISKISGIQEGEDNKESKIEDMQLLRVLTTKGHPEEKIRIEKLIYKHLPLFRPAVEDLRKKSKENVKSPELLAKVIKNWAKVITYYRDKFTHYVFIDKRHENKEFLNAEMSVANDLNQIFTASARVIKERFGLSTELEFLTKGRYRTQTIDGKRSTKLNPNFIYSLQDKNERLNKMGLIFLACQLIEKKYASMLFDQQGYMGRDIYFDFTPAQCKYIREVFSAHRIVLPRGRMDVERNEITIAMDMFNELGKCPKELFEIISKEEQKRFRTKSETTGEEVLLMRHSDRFATLALQYIDNRKVFEKIRFQLSLGKYRYKFYDKTCVDGDTHVRILQKELNGFGRINEIELLKEEKWGGLIRKFEDAKIDTAETKPYITDQYPQYLFNGNRIGIYFNSAHGKAMRNGAYIPDIESGAHCIQPICWISNYELPALIFHHILTKDEKKSLTEKIIIDCVERYKKLFNDIAEGKVARTGNATSDFEMISKEYGIEKSDIPRELQDYFNGTERDGIEQYAKAQIREMIEENRIRLEQFNSKLKKIEDGEVKYGKRDYTEIRTGELAQYLAKDIVMFMPKAKYKPTSKNYNVMQALLATFNGSESGSTLDEVDDMFDNIKACYWKNESDNHPFLEYVLGEEPKDIIAFYKIYLELRGEYLDKCIKKMDLATIPFIHTERKRWEKRDEKFFKELAQRYATQPIELPRGLYDRAIKEYLKSKSILEDVIAQEQCNVTYLIARYMQDVLKDDSQQFYSLPRHYSCLSEKDKYLSLTEREAIAKSDALNNFKKREREKENENRRGNRRYNKGENKNTIKDRDTEEKFNSLYRKMDNNERILRRYKVQDMLLYLLACDIIKGIMREDFGYKLSMITDGKNSNFFDYKMPEFKTTITLKEGKKFTIKQQYLKIKNYGDFLKFIFDLRIDSLLSNGTKVEIDRNILEDELSNYDGSRPKVFETLLMIEKIVVEKHKELKDLEHITFGDVLNVIKMEEGEKKILRLIRNAFSHNYYPTIKDVNYDNMPEVAESLKDILEKESKKLTN